jgi:integrase
MGRAKDKLTARHVASLKAPGMHSDGDRLYLGIIETAAGTISRHWVFLYVFGKHLSKKSGQLVGHQREIRLGSADIVTLAEARRKAQECRELIAEGLDPLEQKAADKVAKAAREAAEAARKTFAQCAIELIKSKKSGWRSAAHAKQWTSTLDTYCEPLHDLFVDEIDMSAVLGVLKPIWAKYPATASRLRGRIEAVLGYAKANKRENPATWKGNLEHILPKRSKLSHSHHAAMDYHDVPQFVAGLREVESVSARAFEFAILTTARSGEVRGAKWSEFDLDAKIWTVPANRMKAGVEHRVPLSGRAIEIIDEMAEHRHSNFVFPGQRRNQPIGKTAMSCLAPPPWTVHGMRSAFRDFAGNESNAPREVCEAALAHAIGGVEAAYRRGDALEKRRALMDAWAQYLAPNQSDNVVSLRA